MPVHGIRDGQCTCGNQGCQSPGKHPRTRRGLKDASKGPDQIRQWLARWPDANIAVRTGGISGIWVLDIDNRDRGLQRFECLVQEHGDPGDAAIQLTGGGGVHRIYSLPDGCTIRSRNNVVPGIDCKGEDGYILVSPSLHVSGTRYEFEFDAEGAEPGVAPDWLFDLVGQGRDLRAVPGTGCTPTEAEIQKVQSALELVDPDPRDDWVLVGAALRHAWGEHGYQVWTEWSKRSDKFDQKDQVRTWESLKDHPTPAGLGTIFHLAKQSGSCADSLTSSTSDPSFLVRPADVRQTAFSGPKVQPYTPFPVHALPEPLSSFVENAAHSMGCDLSYVALPLLAMLAGVVGNTRTIRLKDGWDEPCIVWSAIVGDSGTGKSPPIDLALQPIRNLQHELLEAHRVHAQQHEAAILIHNRDLRRWNSPKGTSGPPPTAPTEPVPERVLVSDTTVEALAIRLRENPRGLLLGRDELSGWISSFDRYSGGKSGADAAHWLEMHGGRSLTVDRKTGKDRVIHVPRAAVSITGGIQTGVLARVLGREHLENGLAARFLLAMPPRQRKVWTERGVPGSAVGRLRELVDGLRQLEMVKDDEGLHPVVLDLTPHAKDRWVEFYNEHSVLQAAASGNMAAALSKLEGYCARLALLRHCVNVATGNEGVAEMSVHETSIESAVTLVSWFAHEADRVYAALAEPSESRHTREMAETIHSALMDSPEGLTRTEINRIFSGNRPAEEIQAGLNMLQSIGPVRSERSQTGGRPQERWHVAGDGRLDEETKERKKVPEDGPVPRGLTTGPNGGACSPNPGPGRDVAAELGHDPGWRNDTATTRRKKKEGSSEEVAIPLSATTGQPDAGGGHEGADLEGGPA